MYGKKVKLRALFLFAALLTLILTIFLVIRSLEENVVYFISPSEIKSLPEIEKKKLELEEWLKRGLLLLTKFLPIL